MDSSVIASLTSALSQLPAGTNPYTYVEGVLMKLVQREMPLAFYIHLWIKCVQVYPGIRIANNALTQVWDALQRAFWLPSLLSLGDMHKTLYGQTTLQSYI